MTPKQRAKIYRKAAEKFAASDQYLLAKDIDKAGILGCKYETFINLPEIKMLNEPISTGLEQKTTNNIRATVLLFAACIAESQTN